MMLANDQRRWHWTKVRKAKADMQTLVWAAAKRDDIQPVVKRIDITVTWYAPNAIHRDSDSLGPLLKASLDALVVAGVIADDSHQYVRRSAHAIDIDRENPRIEIEITELQETAA